MMKKELARLQKIIETRYEICNGCAVCLLSCPVWHQQRDIMLTQCGRTRAVQGGAPLEELVASINSCLLCGACKAVCPYGIDTIQLTLELRRLLVKEGMSSLADELKNSDSGISEDTHMASTSYAGKTLFLPGRQLNNDQSMLNRIIRVLGKKEPVVLCHTFGSDLAMLFEAGEMAWNENVLRPDLDGLRTIIVEEGILIPYFRKALSNTTVIGLGEAMLGIPGIVRALKPTDLYIIETRAYHADFERLVLVYNELLGPTGCKTNLNLQRAAVSTRSTGLLPRLQKSVLEPENQARRILEGLDISRIIIEDSADRMPFEHVSDYPVIHVSELISEEL